MTQSPPPYPYPSPYPYPFPAADPLTPARRAGLLLMILGVVGLLFGGCIGAAGSFYASGQIPIPPENPLASMDPRLITTTMYVLAGLIGLGSLAMIVIGFFARRGSAVACVLGAVLCGLISLLLLLQVMGALSSGGAGLLVIPIVFIGVGLLVLAIVWLVQGAKAATSAPRLPPYGYPPQGYYAPQQPYGYGQAMQGYYTPPPAQQQPQPPQSQQPPTPPAG